MASRSREEPVHPNRASSIGRVLRDLGAACLLTLAWSVASFALQAGLGGRGPRATFAQPAAAAALNAAVACLLAVYATYRGRPTAFLTTLVASTLLLPWWHGSTLTWLRGGPFGGPPLASRMWPPVV